MDNLQTSSKFEAVARVLCEQVFRPLVPKDTGNMRDTATKFEAISSTEFKIYIDAKEAPYVVYTNEPWKSPFWRGKENPNEGWFQKAAERFAQMLAAALGGTIIQEDNTND